MSEKKRNGFTAEKKAAIVRRHLADKVPVSDLCDEYKIAPSVYYRWQAAALANLEHALSVSGQPNRASKRQCELERKVTALEERVAKKDNVIAEISEEYVKLKKAVGEP